MKLTKFNCWWLVIFNIVVAIVYLKVYGFSMAGDSGQWLGAANLFSHLPKLIEPNFNVHFLLCPVVPYIAGTISKLLQTNIINSFFILSLFSYFIDTFLLFKLSLKITGDKLIALITAGLFIIDFQTMHLTLTILADSFTWMAILILINHALSLLDRRNLPIGAVFLTGGISAFAILTKLNLGFVTLIYPLIFFFSNDKERIKKVILWGVITSVVTVPYFWWLTNFLQTPFLRQLTNTVRVDDNALVLQIREFVSAFLYLIPFIVIGIKSFKFKNKVSVICLLFLTLTPVIIWPSIEARYTYVTFWFFIPLAAFGIKRVFNGRKFLFTIFFILLCLLNFSRNYMVINRLSHNQFLGRIYEVYFTSR